MKKILLFCLLSMNAFAQQRDTLNTVERTIAVDDPYYREDQFYVTITHSILQDKPYGFKQNSLSPGISFGFLRDIPLNKARRIAVAPGIGFSYNNLRHNLITLNPEQPTYLVDSNYNKNRQSFWYLEIPLELRWRNSTMESHKFWRVYAGIKYSYLLQTTSFYEGKLGDTTVRNNPAVNKSMVGMYVSAGFNTWNIYAYYGFQPIFKNNVLPENNGLRYFNVGLAFYIL